jgi:hypothetical protein
MSKVTISRRALLARINRKVGKEGLALRVNRTPHRGNLGELFFVNVLTGDIDEKAHWLSDWGNLEAFGREVGALQKYETLSK